MCFTHPWYLHTKTSANQNREEREGGEEDKLIGERHSRSSPSPISNSGMSGHWSVPSGVGWGHRMVLTPKQPLHV